MKYLQEFRDPELARNILSEIRSVTTRPWAIMEVCGGQTHSIIRHGIDQLLPDNIELIHGPGCPVCVTPLDMIDKALAIAAMPNVIFCSFGDMLRVPGSEKDLFRIKSEGGDVRTVYSPLDALKIARENPSRFRERARRLGFKRTRLFVYRKCRQSRLPVKLRFGRSVARRADVHDRRRRQAAQISDDFQHG